MPPLPPLPVDDVVVVDDGAALDDGVATRGVRLCVKRLISAMRWWTSAMLPRLTASHRLHHLGRAPKHSSIWRSSDGDHRGEMRKLLRGSRGRLARTGAAVGSHVFGRRRTPPRSCSQRAWTSSVAVRMSRGSDGLECINIALGTKVFARLAFEFECCMGNREPLS